MNRIVQPAFWLILAPLLMLSCRALNSATLPTISPPTPIVQTVIAPVIIPPAVDLVSQQDALVKIYEKVSPGVVSVRAFADVDGNRGTGFVLDKEGHILTNFHVIRDVEVVEVAFPSGLKTRAQLLGTDPDSDIAVIQVDVAPEQLFPLELGDSDLLKVGQTVLAIGNPFGFEGTMTVGIVSGLGRALRSLRQAPSGGVFSSGDIIQTDAAINPGNSGGPLLNLNGEVIGVNRAIFTTSFSDEGQPLNSGIGFAISINLIKRVVPALIAEGKYEYPYIGITSVDDITLAEQETLNLPRTTGVYVTQVMPGSPADRAGIRAGTRSTSIPGLKAGGDLIIAIDGRPVNTFAEFISYLLRNKSPGDPVVLTVWRDDKEVQISLILDRRPAD